MDETPVLAMPPPRCHDGQAHPTAEVDGSDDDDSMGADEAASSALASASASPARRDCQEKGRPRGQAWASRVLETPSNSAPNVPKPAIVGLRRYGQADPPPSDGGENVLATAQENIKTILADGAVDAVELAIRHKTLEAAASRAARSSGRTTARGSGRAASQQPTRGADYEEQPREGRSKSPRRLQRRAPMEEDA